MEIDHKELKRRAKESMALTQPRPWVVALVFFLLTVGLNFLGYFLPVPNDPFSGFGLLTLFFSLFVLLFRTVVNFGYELWALWTSRRLDPGLGSLTQGFSVAGRVLLMELGVALRTLGWGLLGAMVVSTVLSAPLLMSSPTAFPLLLLLTVGCTYAWIWSVMLRYSLAPFLLADRPDDGASAAIRRSIDLMRGWRWELFKVEFSFAGWYILEFIFSTLALAVCLWLSGFYQYLDAFAIGDIPLLMSGYNLWSNGFALDILELTQAQMELIDRFGTIINSTVATIATQLATLPVFLLFSPYRGVTRAEFYQARLQVQQESAPPL